MCCMCSVFSLLSWLSSACVRSRYQYDAVWLAMKRGNMEGVTFNSKLSQYNATARRKTAETADLWVECSLHHNLFGIVVSILHFAHQLFSKGKIHLEGAYQIFLRIRRTFFPRPLPFSIIFSNPILQNAHKMMDVCVREWLNATSSFERSIRPEKGS